MQTLANVRDDKSDALNDLLKYFIILLSIGVLFCLLQIIGHPIFYLIGQTLTAKLRKRIFNKIMQNDIEFFDNPSNGPGALCSNLENDCSA